MSTSKRATSTRHTHTARQARANLGLPFHRRGLAYFWVLNDRCEWDDLAAQMRAFAAAGNVTALCLHPRAGLLVPYGGDEWFELIRRICLYAGELGLRIWLYDEDPFPSGNAGGRLLAENPGLQAWGLRLFTYDPNAPGDPALFGFPAGPLAWCGLVHEETGETVDLTPRVGILRRRWTVQDCVDSRFYYPDTPLYRSPRGDTLEPEMAVTVPHIPAGMKLVAIVARKSMCAEWVPFGMMDSLNPEATRLFLNSTHEKYRAAVGDLFGREIEAIFTDEPKMADPWPWTPGLFEGFAAAHGYDIRPQLHYLFSRHTGERARLTRLHYRRHVADRFLDAWLRPVAAWCRSNGLKFVGHLSPEDDPIEQTAFLGNSFPILKEFDLCGLDLIIPATGDQRHPVLNVGVVSAVSVAQQNGKQGVMSETGACAPGITGAEIRRIVLWQAIMGVTAPLIHCAFSSMRGPRGDECPPDYGPNSALWPAMAPLRAELADLQKVTHGARQIAPVALLWPIRSFHLDFREPQGDHTGLRRQLWAVLSACLDRQIGVQFIDEEDVPRLEMRNGEACLGLARYTHLLIPPCLILSQQTAAAIRALQRRGVTVASVAPGPMLQEEAAAITSCRLKSGTVLTLDMAVAALPRLLALRGDTTDIRCTAWIPPGGRRPVRLLYSLRRQPCCLAMERRHLELLPATVVRL